MEFFIIPTVSIVVAYIIILYEARKEDGYGTRVDGVHGKRSLPRVAPLGSEADGPHSSAEKKE